MSGGESNTTNVSHNTTNTTDARVAADNGAIVTRGNVTVTDGGAIEAMGDLASDVVVAAEDFAMVSQNFGEYAFDLAHQTMQSKDQLISDVLEKQQSSDAMIGDKLINVGIPALVIGVIAWSAFK